MVSGSLALLYFLLGFHGGRQGSGPDRGTDRGRAGPQAWLAGPQPGWLGLRPGWMAQRGNGRTDECTENLPILQDFVPYWGRCPAPPHENQEESKAGQGNR